MYSYTDLSIIPDNAYKFAQFIEGGCYDNIIYYEFHQEVNPAEIYNCIEGLEEFNNRSGSLHKIFFAYDLVDQVPQ
ncbi:hypothetical protein LVD17_03115 [Fulvivirga ulvae]|uniref:hypothetical protein n=1 Tax=Fulvivirga ulvae TaxID=2904245 RepID=UPI001F334EAF|nr:hypothetical protein [Fulvivirga ulvae]UII32822.1 hypothetical protein LVD17_03115 [Fulvivirga ulvae]